MAKSVLIVDENESVPFDVRVWSEATTLRDAGWRVAVICPDLHRPDAPRAERGASVPVDIIDGVTVYPFRLAPARQGVAGYVREYAVAFAWVARLSWHVWRHSRFDVLQFCNPPDIFFPIALFFRLLGVRVVFDHHDLWPEMTAWRYRGATGTLLYLGACLAEYLSFRCADMVIATNESFRRIAVQRGNVPEHRVTVVRNGPPIGSFGPVEPDAGLKRGFPYLVCYVGIMGFQDGVLELLSSIRYVIHRLGRRDILFALLGDGAARAQALAEVERLGLQPFVSMPGMIYDKLLLRRYLSTADVCLSPEPSTPLNIHSTFIKVGEYMAVGKPIVAYDLTETRYTAQEAAVYVAPGDSDGYGRAIVDLLEDAERRQRMGLLGRQRFLDGLAWDHQQRNLLQAYDAVLGQS
jgi:glycosyltransferase involved in cell wall biosynthesis